MPTDPREIVIAEMRKQTALLERILAALSTASNGNAALAIPDELLDNPKNDPIVKAKSPRDWTGDDMSGRRFSECPPAYLDALVTRYNWFNNTADNAKAETDPKKRRYNELDAARARGWAARLRSGWTAPKQPQRVDETQGKPTW